MNKSRMLNMGQKMILSFCATTALVTISYAKPGGGEGGDRTPPKEAIEICVGQDSGSECTMETPRGKLTGTCQNTPDKKYFVCMPENMRPPKD